MVDKLGYAQLYPMKISSEELLGLGDLCFLQGHGLPDEIHAAIGGAFELLGGHGQGAALVFQQVLKT